MYAPSLPPMSAEEVRELAQNLQKFASDLLHFRRPAVVLTGKIFAIGMVVTSLVGLLVACGQIAAIGVYPARKMYGTYWLLTPFLGIVVPSAFFVGSLAIFTARALLQDAFPQSTNKTTETVVLTVLAIAGI